MVILRSHPKVASPELTTSPAASPAREKAFGPEVRVSGRRMILNIPMQISRLICISTVTMIFHLLLCVLFLFLL